MAKPIPEKWNNDFQFTKINEEFFIFFCKTKCLLDLDNRAQSVAPVHGVVDTINRSSISV